MTSLGQVSLHLAIHHPHPFIWPMHHPHLSFSTLTHTLQVIEKAYKKLRLDAMVIQQGRLTDNTSSKVCAQPDWQQGRQGLGTERGRV